MRMQHSNANTINKKSQPRRFDFPIIGSLTITLNSGVNMRSIENGGRVEWVLYSAANDPRPQMIARPEMIPKLDRK